MTKLLSQVAHVEIFTPDLDKSEWFFTELVGLEVSGRKGGSVYLRTWGEYFHHTVVLTKSERSGLGHIAWRAQGPKELDEIVARATQAGADIGWTEPEPGFGKAFRFRGPNGQTLEVFWEAERWQAPEELASPYPSRPQRFSGKGAAARYLDHVNFPSAEPLTDAKWFEDIMGIRLMEWTELREAPVAIFATLSTGEAFDLALLRDESGIFGRFHHFALSVEEKGDVIRAAEIFAEAGVPIEWGPGRHGHGESMSVYVREPGGMRIEIVSPGRRIPLPDWEPLKWYPDQGSADFYKSYPLPEAFLEVLPPVNASETIHIADSKNPWGK